MVQRYLTHLEKRSDFVEALRDSFGVPDPVQRNREVKAVLDRQRDKIRRLNQGGASGNDTVRFISEMVDTLLRVFWDQVEMGMPDDASLVAVVAVGGYGRMELCPQSDIDLLILTSAKPDGYEISQAESIVRNLWDFGFTVGSSVRSLAQCKEASAKDPDTWTSFLNERFVAGNHELYSRFAHMMSRRLLPWRISTLVESKLRERRDRIARMGALVQLLEPDIKEGMGCLRDVHSMMWIAKVKHDCDNFEDLVREGLITPQEQEDIRVAYDFLLQVRCCIHFMTQKKDDRLNFHLQPEVAAELGFVDDGAFKAVQVFLKAFYHHTKTVNRVVEAVISRWIPAPGSKWKSDPLKKHPHFKSEHRAMDLIARVGNPFRGNLDLILDYFELANQNGLGYAHHAILRLKQAISLFSTQEELDLTGPLHRFLEFCQRPERVGRMLRCMNDVGLLGLLIPDFNYIYCHSHHDTYHIYTTDEHTITVVRQLAYLAKSSEKELESLRGAFEQVTDRELLVLVCFYHDIGKGVGPGHSVSGAAMIFKFLEGMGFSAARCLTASNLVLHHLLMNDVIQRRDLDDPKTIHDFIAKVEGPAFLHKLYVLTYCDVSSVHPSAWSPWKASLLHHLYEAALKMLLAPYESAQAQRRGPEENAVMAALVRVLPQEEARTHLQALTGNYMAVHSPEDMALHAGLLQATAKGDFGVHVSAKPTHWEITVAARDEKALLCRIAGTLAHLGLSILSAKIYTLGGGRVVDRFWVALPEGNVSSPEVLRTRILAELRKHFLLDRGELRELRRRDRAVHDITGDAPIEPKVLASNDISDVFTVMDVVCRDRIGILFQVALVLSELGLNVHGAVLTTEADKATDAFYITSEDGKKITDDARCEEIIAAIGRELASD